MNLAIGVTYIMRNGEFCVLDAFDAGDELQKRFASFQGVLPDKSRSIWRPDGMNFEDSQLDIIAVAQVPPDSPLRKANYMHDFSD